MRKQKKKRLAAKGWKVGSVREFLGLSNEESAYIELKIRLAAAAAANGPISVGPRGKTPIQPIARRQDGSRRPLGFVGPIDLLSYQSRSVGARVVSDHRDSASCIAQRPLISTFSEFRKRESSSKWDFRP